MLKEFKEKYYTALYNAILDVDTDMSEEFGDIYTTLEWDDIRPIIYAVHEEILCDSQDFFKGSYWNNKYEKRVF